MSAAILLALADRCEREPPARELDAAIADYVKTTLPEAMRRILDMGADNPMTADAFLRYTSSLDAAVTLVPEGDRDISISRTSRDPRFPPWQARVCIDTVADDPDETGPQGIANGATAALALVGAALRARAAMAP